MPAAPLILRSALALALLAACGAAGAAGSYPVTPEQRATADRVAQAGVPLAELAENAPDTYTIKQGDTLWDISKIFLRTPWRWPELWGMNKAEIANPHLIYPGQVLMLVKQDGRATLQLAREARDSSPATKLSPRVRSSAYQNAIAAIPMHLIEPFLTEAVVFDSDALSQAPRIVATPAGHVMVTRGDMAYARGNLDQASEYRVFREAHPLKDPETGEVLGYEAPYLGTADLVARGGVEKDVKGREQPVPATLSLRSVRAEIGVGDRLAPVEQREFLRFVPHAPDKSIDGRIVSVYGEALNAGQNQVVSLNKGSMDGLERGHVLTLWKAGRQVVDRTAGRNEDIRLPDTRSGLLLVFKTYKRVSYALIVSAHDAINAGDRFSPP